ncbi:anthranilate synthase component I family protein [Lacipirellula sp.]|uniref:anthranilate synthase component I family protein n=1 Tax=Lacipirellula sp. TaxID=2691419 RepID=UPI003D0983BA
MSESAAPPLPLIEPLPSGASAVVAFERLAPLPHVVFFDSAARDPRLGRYSFVAADPFAWIECPADGSDALAAVEELWKQFTPHAATHAGLPPFQGGLAGLLSYDLNRSLERVPAPRFEDLQTPALAVGAYDVVVAFDHVEHRAWLISQGLPEIEPRARRERAEARLAEFKRLLFGNFPSPPPASAHAEKPGSGSPQTELSLEQLAPQFDMPMLGVSSNMSAAAYREMVRRGVEYIHAGDVFQVNLSQRLLHAATSSSRDLYLRLRERNPAPYAGYFDLGEWQICSASPECFLTVRDRQVETRPIKGTRGRSPIPEADLFAGDDLESSEKDRAENVMIVDLMRNDLSRVCTAESVHIEQLCRLETYAFVKHLVSVVRGELRPECSPLDLLRASFPGGSITGAPKVRAMEIIAELEPTARGPYCGSLMYLGFDGAMDASILIRTITAGRGWWQLPVGGGIVAQSDPDDEYRETWHKARGMLKALV